MPFLANLLLYRQTGQRKRRMDRALCLLEYGADQMINGRLFPNVPSLRATSRQGYLGHARPPISRRFLVTTAYRGAAAASNWRRRKSPPCGKKKAENEGTCLHMDTFSTSSLARQPIGAKVPFHRLRWPATSRQPGERRCSTASLRCPRTRRSAAFSRAIAGICKPC